MGPRTAKLPYSTIPTASHFISQMTIHGMTREAKLSRFKRRRKGKRLPQTKHFWVQPSRPTATKAKAVETMSCPLCWGSRHACQRATPKDQCHSCNHQLAKGSYGTAASTPISTPYPIESIARGFQNHQNIDKNLFNPFSTTSPPDIVEPSTSVTTLSANLNVSVEDHFDKIIWDNFSVQLEGKSDSLDDLVTHASLAGGILAYLLTTPGDQEKLHSTRGGIVPLDVYSQYSHGLGVTHFSMDRLGVLVEPVIHAFRAISPGGMADKVPYSNNLAFAAAAICHQEIKHFNAGFKKSPLYTEIPQGVKDTFSAWLCSLELELRDRLRHSCGKFLAWRSVIDSSVQDLLRWDTRSSIARIYFSRKETSHNNEGVRSLPLDPVDDNQNGTGIGAYTNQDSRLCSVLESSLFEDYIVAPSLRSHSERLPPPSSSVQSPYFLEDQQKLSFIQHTPSTLKNMDVFPWPHGDGIRAASLTPYSAKISLSPLSPQQPLGRKINHSQDSSITEHPPLVSMSEDASVAEQTEPDLEYHPTFSGSAIAGEAWLTEFLNSEHMSHEQLDEQFQTLHKHSSPLDLSTDPWFF